MLFLRFADYFFLPVQLVERNTISYASHAKWHGLKCDMTMVKPETTNQNTTEISIPFSLAAEITILKFSYLFECTVIKPIKITASFEWVFT